MPGRPRIFISHISEEKAPAAQLKRALTRDFLGLVDVFVSSDTESISAGEEWLQSVAKALRECAAVVILCSPESVKRPWINVEAGAAWMRDIPLVPVCHLGLLPRDDRDIRDRLRASLETTEFEWRSLERVAIGAAISEERAADLLRSDPEVRFSKGKSVNVIVGLRSRVGA